MVSDFRVLILTHMRPGATPRRWHRLPPLLAGLGWEVLHLPRGRWREFIPALVRFRPRAVVAAGPIAFLPALLRRRGLLRSFLVHDWLDDYAENVGSIYGRRLVSGLERIAVAGADLVTSPSAARAERARRAGKRAVFVPHGVEEDFDAVPPRDLPGRNRVGYVGIVNRAKRVDRLIEAARGLDCDLYLVGPAEEELVRSAPPNAHFLGDVPSRAVAGYVKSFDVAVLTMDNDSCVKMVEYIRARRPIAALAGKAALALKDNEEALIANDLRPALKRLLADAALRASLSAALARRETLTWPEAAARFARAVEDQLRRS